MATSAIAFRSSGRRTLSRRLAFVGLVLIAFVAGALSSTAAGIGARTHPTEFALIADSWELIQTEYVDAEHLDPRALAHGAISGMADAVGDTGHTYFLTPDEAAAEKEAMSGAYGGIGVDFRVAGEPSTISTLVPGAPAEVAGIKVGDKVTAVDGKQTSGPDIEDVIDRIAGSPGTDVVLTVARPGHRDLLEFRITRAIIDSDSAGWAMIPGTHLALVQLADFSEGATQDLAADLNSAVNAGASGLILDLRGNPGGIVEEAVGVAGLFLQTGDVVLRVRTGNGTETVDTVPEGGAPTDLPLVVLVDGDSASSAEVVAGALHDSHRATLVGTTTFGTGTILTDFPLADDSDLAIGTETWLTPSGRSAWHVGLVPDVEVDLPAGAFLLTPDALQDLSARKFAKSNDVQLLRAIEVLGS